MEAGANSIFQWVLSMNAATWTLLVLTVAGLAVAWRAQTRDDFDFARMLLDSNGKPSATRMGTFVCLAVSTYVLILAFINAKDNVTTNVLYMFGIYLAVWSGAKVIERAIDAWVSIKGGNPLPPAPQVQTPPTAEDK